ncbi:MAG TPA: ABC transporter permease [Stellaceae bacterium]|nr:ABC transporter permease [Stellaceae bacterium]
MSQAPLLAGPPRLRSFGTVNWIGFWTLYAKEVRRFLKVVMQSVAAPVVTTLLFLAIFLLALGGGGRQIAGVPYVEFLVPGLVMMAITQNAFANTSSSLVIGKMQGNIVDLLTPPLSPAELVLALTLGGATRGVVVGFAVGVVLAPLAALHLSSVAAILYYSIAGSVMMSLLGILGGLWADKFDHLAAVTNFIVTPLTFLSGTFYSVAQLPESWRLVAHLNPFFYMIDGFRYGFTGTAEGSLVAGVTLMAGIDLLLLAWCHRLFVTGYKLKA